LPTGEIETCNLENLNDLKHSNHSAIGAVQYRLITKPGVFSCSIQTRASSIWDLASKLRPVVF